jgi:DNA polymerase-3 subunit gamma/tau
MLSKAAFNALLKTIEEPPPHAIFILASTELHKIPATIISRCQRFSFRRLSEGEIEGRLREVAQKESLAATDGALAAIARASDGSLRDALSLLDQAGTLAGGSIDEQRCAEIFAFVDRSTLEALFGAIVAGDRAAVVGILARAREEGLDPRHGSRELLAFLREVLMASAGQPQKDEKLARLAALAPYETILRAVAIELETERDFPKAADPWIVWEMALLKMAELPRLRSIEQVLSGLPRSPATPAPPATGEPRFVSLVPAAQEPAPPPLAGEDPSAKFVKILEARRVTVGAYVSLASRIEEKDGELLIEFPIDKASAKDSLSRPDAFRLLSEAAKETWGRELTVRLLTGPPADGNLTEAARRVPPQVLSRERASSRAQEDPMVQKAMALFRGEVVDIKEKK